MKFASTRGAADALGFSGAVMEGLASDGGLFVPETLPDTSCKLESWRGLPYPKLCFEFLRLFADDIPASDLEKIVDLSYKKFDDAQIAPLSKLDEKTYLLELYHGPTLAFKDFALQFLGNLYEYLLEKSGRVINVLGATSGDTGSAAINGLLGKKNVSVFILYPDGRVSPLQERQMACTGAQNVFPIAINGTFDDAQAIVKELFARLDFKKQWSLAAVNSINLARILAQCVYYIYAYLKLPKEIAPSAKFVVPTGNFGNILAGWLAHKMGMPARGFCVATNQNDILYRLFKTGRYEIGKVEPSYAPSMDIQVSSNFERFIYFAENKNTAKVREIMSAFKSTGKWIFSSFNPDAFSSTRCGDSSIKNNIRLVFEKYGKIIDPHTACGFEELDGGVNVVLSTAHPAKFPEVIKSAISAEAKSPILEELKTRRIERLECKADADLIKQIIEKRGIRK
ncbi:MAG: threonine synthase [Opitutales bacterium]|nr:threonine synthase [Opitutales bacterium]